MPKGHENPLDAPKSRRDELEALQGHLKAAIGVAEPKELPALSREMRAVMAELAALPNPSEESKVVNLRDRIARKQAAAG